MNKTLIKLYTWLENKLKELNEEQYISRRKMYCNDNIEVINLSDTFNNNQLLELSKVNNAGHYPLKLIICKNRKDVINLKNYLQKFNYLITIFDIDVILGKSEVIYLFGSDTVIIFEYSFDDYLTIKEKQENIIKAIYYGFRLRGQEFFNYKNEEQDADNYSNENFDRNLSYINNIMNWN